MKQFKQGFWTFCLEGIVRDRLPNPQGSCQPRFGTEPELHSSVHMLSWPHFWNGRRKTRFVHQLFFCANHLVEKIISQPALHVHHVLPSVLGPVLFQMFRDDGNLPSECPPKKQYKQLYNIWIARNCHPTNTYTHTRNNANTAGYAGDEIPQLEIIEDIIDIIALFSQCYGSLWYEYSECSCYDVKMDGQDKILRLELQRVCRYKLLLFLE